MIPQMDSYIAHLKKCLNNIHKVIKKANDILCNISQPAVCSEVLLSSRGTDYISGVLEVYRVSKRMEGGMAMHNIEPNGLRIMFRDIELTWNNLQAFLAMCPCILQKLPPPSVLNCTTATPHLDTNPCLSRCCGICLLEGLNEEQIPEEPADSLQEHKGHLYHSSCANFWLNCVDSTLPVLSCHSSCPFCIQQKNEIL
ncbi:synergin gamma isoform X2 [Xenopus laevis]|uniref:Synergin gamma isoform X2 n=1 Tax=Xenopus laevis TaxID=8355 RepID=A0A8J0VCU2_XENLA|nr:synergin gamma isoform X2 [Xenopus laevis]